ncbi:TetR/AcrR family transcriptional regulator [uncultured Schumannella sp.]|uniref:TetR/AcrR family transcriptional regulator n=1 Tax=uncultured Schumannella sp. TaxID=1195956 RepID=UPI0025E431BB|nr:TetR family transcriptional regulator [uncultured Schumannella sp.]
MDGGAQSEQRLDPRQRRTRAALAEAVLALAADRGIDGLTVTELTARAQVHRSTFYQHASTPLELLKATLAGELDALRARYLLDLPRERTESALRGVTIGVLEHVERHAAIYGRLDTDAGATLHSFLGAHFAESARILIAQSSVDLPDAPEGVSPSTARAAVRRYIADGFVGAIAAWLHEPPPRDAAAFAEFLDTLMPSWWAHPARGGSRAPDLEE